MKNHTFTIIVLLLAALICLLVALFMYGGHATHGKQSSTLDAKIPLYSVLQIQHTSFDLASIHVEAFWGS